MAKKKKKKGKNKVVLAYSGGLDTSICIRWLKEKHNLDVIALTVDLGQGDDPNRRNRLLYGRLSCFFQPDPLLLIHKPHGHDEHAKKQDHKPGEEAPE